MGREESEAQRSGRPVPALVHLSGPRRGSTVRLRGRDVSIGSGGASAAVGERDAEESPAAHLVRQGLTYRLLVTGGHDVWVNGEKVGELTLASGDVLEIGRGGPILRFRLYESGIPSHKSVREAFSDCLDCARYGSRSLLGRAAIFLSSMPRELLTRTSVAFRAGVLAGLLLLAGASAFLVHRSVELEERLAAERSRVEGLRDLVERTVPRRITADDLEDLRAEVRETAERARSRLDSLEARSGAPARIIEEASRSVVFLQGSFRFRDPRTGRYLRVQAGSGRGPGGNGGLSVGPGADGPMLEPHFTGSAFLASREGLVVTNRHVVRPWEVEPPARRLAKRGFVPEMRRLVAWFPGLDHRLEVKSVSVSDAADVAVLRISGVPDDRPVLELAGERPGPGEEVIVLGYPLGIRALLARADSDFLIGLARRDSMDAWEVARRLGSEGRIEPLASRGIVSQLGEGMVVYDAETTAGGSGGPVLDLEGRVVAVNRGTMPEFGGSNMGVPAGRVRAFLDRVR